MTVIEMDVVCIVCRLLTGNVVNISKTLRYEFETKPLLIEKKLWDPFTVLLFHSILE